MLTGSPSYAVWYGKVGQIAINVVVEAGIRGYKRRIWRNTMVDAANIYIQLSLLDKSA